ncbi:MAG: TolC family protein [Planctomycetaceae bacterium]
MKSVSASITEPQRASTAVSSPVETTHEEAAVSTVGWQSGDDTDTADSLPAIPEPSKIDEQPVDQERAPAEVDGDLTAPNVDLPDITADDDSDASDTGEQQPAAGGQPLRLNEVVTSVHQSYPLLEVAYQDLAITDGTQLAAWGQFDTKLKATSENGPTSFYPTYRNSAGFERPIYQGGEIFGGYRIGRGNFEPWYQERQTNDGGEFKAGLRVPLLRNRDIDARRAELWRATYDQQRARPEVQSQLILFVRDASVFYWAWIAAGQKHEIGRRALELSLQRNEQLERRVEVGDLDPPVLQDNLRSIALREAKLIDRERKLNQAAVKLSLFYRAASGSPVVVDTSRIHDFPDPTEVLPSQLDNDVSIALSQRPELVALDAQYRRAGVDLAEAQNDCLPSLDAQLAGSQDVGQPTSSKRDKSQFELEAGVYFDVPVERRKARGKSYAASAKLRQISAKRRFTQDKIVAELQLAYAALTAAFERVERTREALRLAEYMADVERRKFDLGAADLLAVFLREQAAIEAADDVVDATLEYFVAQADYAAAMAIDWPRDQEVGAN